MKVSHLVLITWFAVGTAGSAGGVTKKKVLIIGVDGLGGTFGGTFMEPINTPNYDALIADGTVHYGFYNDGGLVPDPPEGSGASGANWSTFLTGAATPPGRRINNSGVPGAGNAENNNGVREWTEWTVTDPSWWSQAAGDRSRSQFNLGSGALMVADPDEWDDQPHPAGAYNTFIRSPSVALNDADTDTTHVMFDSNGLSPAEAYQRSDVDRFEAPFVSR